VVPVGYASPKDDASIDLPVGLQILGPVLGEAQCLMVGHVMEQAMRNVVESKKPKIF
jgi:Asp-tRNA(Asn)/Glu-tRNA(Gln) amidotransferase A subunit family amidase